MTDDVAVFLDLDNIIISARELNQPFDIHLILKHLETITNGRIVLRRAYGDWRQTQNMPETLAAAGFELQSVVRMNGHSKNLADMQMVVDALETLIDGHEFTTYALLTGDRDFTPLVQTLRKRGKRVIGLGFKSAASRSLVRLCDDYVFYGQLMQPAVRVNGKQPENKPRKQPVHANGRETSLDSDSSLSTRYARALRKSGLRVIPPGDRMLILKEMVSGLTANGADEWGAIVRQIHDRFRSDGEKRQSKNAINSVLIAAKRARIIEVGRGDTLSTAPVSLLLKGSKPFQEAILQCDALYLQGIMNLELPFDLEQAAIALYGSPAHARYLKIIHGRYNVPAEANGSAISSR